MHVLADKSFDWQNLSCLRGAILGSSRYPTPRLVLSWPAGKILALQLDVV